MVRSTVITVPRRCRVLDASSSGESNESRLLEEFRDEDAYVLLGDPGAGKTTAFRAEATASNSDFVKARDFVTLEPERWRGRTLFIDGLDEVRAGQSDQRQPFDAIRQRLDFLGGPKFRLSCRGIDWFGNTDTAALEKVARRAKVTLLGLEPLSEADIEEILRSAKVENPREFILRAREHNLDALLGNPQILLLLAKVVVADGWPVSREELFEKACRRLAIEDNEEHDVAAPADSQDEVMRAAGALSAVQLISGVEDVPKSPRSGHLSIRDVVIKGVVAINDAVETKLFATEDDSVRLVHRTVAEYLGARFLAERIRQGLPAGRVLALITGEDGGVVSSLRGLAGWLATLCPTLRWYLIGRDPLGMLAFAELSAFTDQEKRRLLGALEGEAKRFPHLVHRLRGASDTWLETRIAKLASAQMTPILLEVLRSEDRSAPHQAIAEIAVYGLARVDTEDVAAVLFAVARDARWWPRLRSAALDVLVGESSTRRHSGRLRALLDDIHRGVVSDARNELEGRLLQTLYGNEVSPHEVLNYLHTPDAQHFVGYYRFFWGETLLSQTQPEDLPRLLDDLVLRRASGTTSRLEDDFALELLARTLESLEEPPDGKRLYAWLGVALDEHGYLRRDSAPGSERVRAWLTAHPRSCFDVITIGMAEARGEQEVPYVLHMLRWHRLFGAHPVGLTGWFLRKARESSSDRLARALFNEGVTAARREYPVEATGLSDLELLTRGDARLEAWLAEALSSEEPEWQQRQAEREAGRQAKWSQEQETWQRELKTREGMLRAGTAPPGIMHTLAMVYYDRFSEPEGRDPVERFANLVNSDRALVGLIFEALRRCIDRNDLPSLDEILALSARKRVHYLTLPFLAGLEILAAEGKHVPEARLREAVASWLVELGNDPPLWLADLLQNRPVLVGEVLVGHAHAAFAAGKQLEMAWRLRAEPEWRPVAASSILALLRAFPVRARTEQLETLDDLLETGLVCAEPEMLADLVQKKLTSRSMHVVQRGRWLGAGLVAAPMKFLPAVEAYARKGGPRIHHLAAFLARDRIGENRIHRRVCALPTDSLRVLISLLGESFVPHRPAGAHFVTAAMRAADLVDDLIKELGHRSEAEASTALADLVELPKLQRWREMLQSAREEQRRVRRDASYAQPTAQDVLEVLRRGRPANPADLLEVVTEAVVAEAEHIRNGPADSYRHYWNTESGGRLLVRPKTEGECRDLLFAALRPRLEPCDVRVDREGDYAEHKRADLRTTAGALNVPIEVKMSNSGDVWTAIDKQLVPRYARDPDAHGRGLFVVFWLGVERVTQPPKGSRPKSAKEMKEHLLASLTEDCAMRTRVVVIDIADPQTSEP